MPYGLLARLSAMESEQGDLEAVVNQKAPKRNPAFTGTVTGIDKTMVGLGNVDNTSDQNQPISETLKPR